MKEGRPTKYKVRFANEAKKLGELGITDYELSEFFEVAVSTIYLWKLKHPKFSEALKVGKDSFDDRIERSLASRAIGYQCPDVHFSSHEGEVTATDFTRHYPPDAKACIIWLANRRQSKWKMRGKETTENEEAPKPQKVVIEIVDGKKK